MEIKRGEKGKRKAIWVKRLPKVINANSLSPRLRYQFFHKNIHYESSEWIVWTTIVTSHQYYDFTQYERLRITSLSFRSPQGPLNWILFLVNNFICPSFFVHFFFKCLLLQDFSFVLILLFKNVILLSQKKMTLILNKKLVILMHGDSWPNEHIRQKKHQRVFIKWSLCLL